MKILLLDANSKVTLAIARHLGRYRKDVINIAGHEPHSLAFCSRYCTKKIISPKITAVDDFLKFLVDHLTRNTYDLLIPVGFNSFQFCTDREKEISALVKLIIPGRESFRTAINKMAAYDLAEQLGVPYPRTFRINNPEEISNLGIPSYPVVIKGPFECGKGIIDYASSKDELIRKFRKMCSDHRFSAPFLPIIQEYITGDGYGFFAIYDHGVCKNVFMHHRIREFPSSGGASVCAESFRNDKLQEYGRKLLDHLGWHGVAMVEFKKNNASGDYNLMEINAKFWGSLDLALAAGVAFPSYLCDMAEGKTGSASGEYRQTRFQWLLNGELFHFFERPSSFFRIFADLFRSKNDIWFRDIRPNLFQLILIVNFFVKKRKK